MSPAPPARTPRFWHEPWLVALLVLVCPPVGLIALGLTPEIEAGKKWAMLGLLGLFLLFFAGVEAGSGEFEELFTNLRSRVYEKAARGLAREGRLEEARDLAVRANDLTPDRRSTAWTASKVARKMEDDPGRRRWLELACKDDEGKLRKKSNPGWRVELGWARLRDGDLDGVDEVLETLDGPPAKRAGAPVLRAARLLADGKADRAEDSARRVVVDFIVARFGEAYWEIARAAEARGDPLTAAYFYLESFRHGAPEEYTEVQERVAARSREAGVPTAPPLAFLRAMALRGPFDGKSVDEHTVEEADRMLAHILEKDPDFWAGDLVLHTRASFYFYQKKDWEKALALYQESLDRFPRGETRCRCLYQTIRTLRKLERLDEAEIRAQETERACPGNLAASARSELRRIRRQRLREAGDR